jgi:hypothetical protein
VGRELAVGLRRAHAPAVAAVELLEDDAAERRVLDDVVLDDDVVEPGLGAVGRFDLDDDAAGALRRVPAGLELDPGRIVVGGVAADPVDDAATS